MDCSGTGVYIKTEKLETYARNAALTGKLWGKTGLRRETASVRAALERLRTLAGRLALAGEPDDGAQDFMNNWFVAQRAGLDAVRGMRSAGRVPALESGEAAVAALARAAVSAGQGAVNEERLALFLRGYQQGRALTERELGALIPALNAALVGCLDRAAGIGRGDERAAVYGNVFASMRFLAGFDASGLLEEGNVTEQILRRDPSGIYPQMDDETRAAYRRELERLAGRRGLEGGEAARRLVERARGDGGRHVGRYLFGERRAAEKRRSGGGWYVPALVLLSLGVSLLIAFAASSVPVALLLAVPVSEIVKNGMDVALMRFSRPTRLPRLELKDGIPPEGKTLCVISALLTGPESAARYASLLEQYALTNRDAGRNLLFGLLADLPEAGEKETAADGAIRAAAENAVRALNSRRDGGFCLIWRERTYSAAAGSWMGWERKRGAIVQLARYLRGRRGEIEVLGDGGVLDGVRYLITLDGDTCLTAGAARTLVGAAMHPLNEPVVDERRRVVVAGSGILQPRVSTELSSAGRTDFARIFAGRGGVDPYGAVTSDVYQDVFGRGSFTGKGLIHIDAFLRCADGRFPEQTVLSHDLLEGALLRCAYMGDTELTDGCPSGALSYFDRMHRWVRGDWQNARWLGRRVPAPAGGRVPNPLSGVDRWKIFDNLRRSAAPVFAFAALAAGMLTGARGLRWAAAVALVSYASRLLIGAAQDLLHRGGTRERVYSAVIPGFAGALMHTLVRLALLPYEAWVCLSAILTALYRMLVSGRNMLRWVTAAESEQKKSGAPGRFYRRMWPCVPAGLFAVGFAAGPLAAAAGVVWLGAPLIAWTLSLERPRAESALSEADRLLLLNVCGGVWRYFRENLTAEDHFLPPDNVQEQPALGRAHRTSPTNIGLALLAVLAARDMGFAGREEALRLLSAVLDTAERLPKWRGHLYNWYDTRSLAVLGDACVSTVDSGNLAGCLIALRAGAEELGAPELAARADRLRRAMDFSALYDQKRGLFFIGWSAAAGKPTGGWYDLLASEARLTSYIAVASGQVPRRHWRCLGRLTVSRGGYSGLASWTGTMFEYLMPELLLPLWRDSLLYESARFCIGEQRRRAGARRPWGESEGAFAAFDAGMSYRYKANGVQSLALRRGMDDDCVVTPYASFLALCAQPRAAARNLRRLRELGAEGRYGFREALDYTPRRANGGPFALVRTYMAHHLGMSIAAADNALFAGVMQRRFMADREMAAFQQLLQEKIPLAPARLRRPEMDVPEKPLRQEGALWRRTLSGTDALEPGFCILSSGAYTVLLSETGASRSRFGSAAVTVMDPEALGRNGGVTLDVRTQAGPLSPAPWPYYDRETAYETEFTGAQGCIRARRGRLSSALTVSVPPAETGELRALELCWNGEEPLEAEITCWFEPCLEPEADWRAHPAFARLGLEAEQAGGALLVRRRTDGRREAPVLCLAASRPAQFGTSRLEAMGRGTDFRPGPLRFFASSPDFFAAARVRVRLEPGRPARTAFAVALAQTGPEARSAALRLLAPAERAGASRLDAAAAALGMTAEAVNRAMDRISALLLPRPADTGRGAPPRDALWRFGVSGDLPVLTARVPASARPDEAAALVAEHIFLRENGFDADLLLLLPDGGDYRQPLRRRLTALIGAIGYENEVDARGGVHFADLTDPGAEDAAAASQVCVTLPEKPRAGRESGRMPPERRRRSAPAGAPDCGWEADGSFFFNVRGALPETAWSHMLTNGRFGFLATDAGTGFLWKRNARERRVNRWLNDPLAAEGTERLELVADGRRVSLFAAEDGCPCRVTYGFGFARWEKTVGGRSARTTAFVPWEGESRILLLELAGCGAEDRVEWYTDLLLGSGEPDAAAAETSFDGAAFTARSARFGGVFRMETTAPVLLATGSRDDWLTARRGAFGRTLRPCGALVMAAGARTVLRCGCGERETGPADWAGAEALLGETAAFWSRLVRPVTLCTGFERLDRYGNGWALYQTIACRMLGRTSLYQSGGAYGFRDQLQDACAALWSWPELARETILRAAGRQYAEGDVQHWWHEENDRGVRTRCSDDLLWLPWALCRYVRATGDRTILDARAPYLASPPLGPEERERYEQADRAPADGTVRAHALLAADTVLRRGVGAHGLCLIGGGDWNDGMNGVGAAGRGESVWLTWFAADALDALSVLCRETGAGADGERYAAAADALRRAAEAAWDGGWYLRGWYDGGGKLGGAERDECRIDSVAQSFAACAHGDPARVRTALRNAAARLYDPESGVVRLFEPPFDSGAQRPGYIRAYAPGFRENGGQYTHAAVWLAMAMLRAGLGREGLELLLALTPDGRDPAAYKGEPYVLAADVYAAPEHVGRAGWSWYTGSAGWFWQAYMELGGLELRDGAIRARAEGSRLPEGCTARLPDGGGELRLRGSRETGGNEGRCSQ